MSTLTDTVPHTDLYGRSADASDYYTFEIPKHKKIKGKKVLKGHRVITAPKAYLKLAQKEICAELAEHVIGVHNAAHAYRAHRGTRSMAECHTNKRWVIRLDLENFFSSITQRQVMRALPRSVPGQLKRRITRLCFLDGVLPQGAPSSPVLSNLALYMLDCRLQGLCNHWRMFNRPIKVSDKKVRFESIHYTRYSDDLVFSSDYAFLPEIVPILKLIIEAEGLKVHPRKTIVSKASSRQYVTGVVVNKKLSISRDSRKLLRATMHKMIHNIASGTCPAYTKLDDDNNVVPIDTAQAEDPLCQLAGQISAIAYICPEQAASLKLQLRVLRDVCLNNPNSWAAETTEYLS